MEVVGDRWTLLIVMRLYGGPRRFADVAAAHPGLSSNLLSDRLRRLVDDGLVVKRELAPPAATTVYELTGLGRGLGPAMLELMRWGTVWLLDADRIGEPTHDDWAHFPLGWLAMDHAAASRQVIRVEVGALPTTVTVVEGSVATLESDPDTAESTLTLRADAMVMLGPVLAGYVPLDQAIDTGMIIAEGDLSWLRDALAAGPCWAG